MDLEKILSEFENTATIAKLCGGTHASIMLRKALQLQSIVKTPEQAARMEKVIEQWRNAILRHNAHPERFLTYDVVTGSVLSVGKNMG